MNNRAWKITHAIILGAIFVFSFYLNSVFPINHDVAWLIEVSKRLLAGGSYANDFFENNPPFILYFYAPLAWLAQKIGHMKVLLMVYFYAITFLSLYLSNRLLTIIFSQNDTWLKRSFMLALISFYLLMPFYDFAQREHFTIVMIMPYCLLVTARLKQGHPSKFELFTIGFLGACGFLLKPYFLLSFIALEAYFCWEKRSYKAWMRSEVLLTMALTLLYLMMIVCYHRDYLTIILPLAIRWCYRATQLPLKALCSHLLTAGIPLICLQFIILNRQLSYKRLSNILMLLLTSFIIIFLIQRVLYRYHTLPFAFFALLLSVLFFYESLKNYKNLTWQPYCLAITSSLVIFLTNTIIWTSLIFYQAFFLGYFAFFYFISYMVLGRSIKYALGVTALIILCAYLVTYLSSHTEFFPHTFALTTLFLLASFYLSLTSKHKINLFLLTLNGILLFCTPFNSWLLSFNFFSNKEMFLVKNRFGNILSHLGQHKKIYFIASYTTPYGIVATSNIIDVTRFSHAWVIPGMMYATDRQSIAPTLKEHLTDDKQYFINMIRKDLVERKPDYVFIDRQQEKQPKRLWNFYPWQKSLLASLSLNYLDFFMQDNDFKTVWANYYYLMHYDYYGDPSNSRMSFDIYARQQENPGSSQ